MGKKTPGRIIRALSLVALLTFINVALYLCLAIAPEEFPLWFFISISALFYLAIAFLAGAVISPLLPLRFEEIIPVASVVPVLVVAFSVWWAPNLDLFRGLMIAPVLVYKLLMFGGGWDVYLFLFCNMAATGIGLYLGHYYCNAREYTKHFLGGSIGRRV